jgi:hypothetical protein
MPGLQRVPRDVRTVYLGQFLDEHARRIAVELDAHGIVWWSKEPNLLTRFWDPGGVHLFVDRTKLDEARDVVAAILDDDPS